jgi:hypothetical protein
MRDLKSLILFDLTDGLSNRKVQHCQSATLNIFHHPSSKRIFNSENFDVTDGKVIE